MSGADGGGEEGRPPGAAALPSFECLHPARFVVFSFPNPSFPSDDSDSDLLRVAVLDSPAPAEEGPPPPPPPPPAPPSSPATAGMLVPSGRESDWLFSTAAGHLQLLLSAAAARLVLIGLPPSFDSPPPLYALNPSRRDSDQNLIPQLQPLLLALSPRSAFRAGTHLPDVPFFSYEDGIVRSAIVEIAAGPIAGEMVVEDVEIEPPEGDGRRERRRRLRFKRLPNLVQTQMRLLPDGRGLVDTEVLVQPYLAPMVAGLLLLLPGPWIQRKTALRRAVCLGVGGGALLTFLERRLHFEVYGVEADEAVLSAAKRHFGLVEGEFLKVTLGDAIAALQSASPELCADAIMVDLDAEDSASGTVAPPPEFVTKEVILSARAVLREREGIMVINVIPPNGYLHGSLVGYLREEFSELYEIDAGNGENVVLIAAVASPKNWCWSRDGPIAETLRQVLEDDSFADAIKRI